VSGLHKVNRLHEKKNINLKIFFDMKTLKLNALANQTLDAKEMNHIVGGEQPRCCCACAGSSGVCNNNNANAKGGLSSPECLQAQSV
jgi:natural product precursor